MSSMRCRALGGMAVVLLASGAAHSGELSPPGGAVAPTMKDLVEVEPRVGVNADTVPGDLQAIHRILQSGSYYLTDNVAGEAGKFGVIIQASDVTLDLNGFALIGEAGSFDGVAVIAGAENVTIRNGAARGWGEYGVDAFNADGAVLIEGVTCYDNDVGGIIATRSVVRFCAATANGQVGIRANQSLVVDCNASANLTDGFILGEGTHARSCVANRNGQYGFHALTGTPFVHVETCTAERNASHGIVMSSSSVVRGNLCGGNGFGGASASGIFVVFADSVVEGNVCAGNSNYGIELSIGATDNLIVQNRCRDNTNGDFLIGANNAFGPLITVGAAGDLSLVAGADHPQANFEY